MATLKVPTITRTMACDSEPGDVSQDGSDVFDTVTQLDEETVKVLSHELTYGCLVCSGVYLAFIVKFWSSKVSDKSPVTNQPRAIVRLKK